MLVTPFLLLLLAQENDINGDGKDDVFYISDDEKYIEMVDRNFDGKIDAKTFYWLSNHNAFHGEFDEDFDGRYETKIEFKNSLPHVAQTIDIKNRLINATVYCWGIPQRSYQPFINVEGKSVMVVYEYPNGFPKKIEPNADFISWEALFNSHSC